MLSRALPGTHCDSAGSLGDARQSPLSRALPPAIRRQLLATRRKRTRDEICSLSGHEVAPNKPAESARQSEHRAARDHHRRDPFAAFSSGSLEETENALVAYGRERERQERLVAAVESSREATALANELYTRGLADFLSVLDAQRQQLAAEDDLAKSETASVTSLVALYKALGGGWEAVR